MTETNIFKITITATTSWTYRGSGEEDSSSKTFYIRGEEDEIKKTAKAVANRLKNDCPKREESDEYKNYHTSIKVAVEPLVINEMEELIGINLDDLEEEESW